ncbi:MAG: AAA family ATPase [Carbonactinosporaceae bacterium]
MELACGERLHYPSGVVLVVAGLPGAGKTTFIARLFHGAEITIIDPDHLRERYGRWLPGVPYRAYRPLVHFVHYRRVAGALRRPEPGPATGSATGSAGTVVVHETTRPLARRWLSGRAARAGRPLHLIALDVPEDVALQGQASRGRVLNKAAFQRHCRRWRAFRGTRTAAPERYASVLVLDRAGADALRAVSFLPNAGMARPGAAGCGAPAQGAGPGA